MNGHVGLAAVLVSALFAVFPLSRADAGSAAASQEFTVRIENVSKEDTLKPSNGAKAPAAVAPGVWAVHRTAELFFTPGKPDRGRGLEALAEDGNPGGLAESLKNDAAVASSGVYSVPVGASGPGPIGPGGAYEFLVTGQPGMRLSFAMMFGQSNDLFYAPGAEGIALFDESGKPIMGDITARTTLWDAGTEVNEEPGVGPNQAPRQSSPNTGPRENGVVRPIAEVRDGFTYPAVSEVLRVTIAPVQKMAR
jgi:hypothetical protein